MRVIKPTVPELHSELCFALALPAFSGLSVDFSISCKSSDFIPDFLKQVIAPSASKLNHSRRSSYKSTLRPISLKKIPQVIFC